MDRVLIIGAGLVGPLLAIYLARRGYRVAVYDRRARPRPDGAGGGKSINLTFCERGFRALDRAGVGEPMRRLAIPAYGRVMHDSDGSTTYQPYGNRGEAIHSIARSEANQTLIAAAEGHGSIDFLWHQECREIDLDRPAARFRDRSTGRESWVTAQRIFGADGAFSRVRRRLQRLDRFEYSQHFVAQGYKELHLPAAADGGSILEPEAIHIWPRGPRMLIGFANTDGSFTLALHLPFEGEVSFETITAEDDVRALFRREFPDVLPRIPRLVEDFFDHPISSMPTIRCFPWTFEDKIALIGDAAHAIVPSYGQGANCGFEDCAVLCDCLERSGDDWGPAMKEYERRRKVDADAIAELALEHFEELQELVGDATFLLRKRIERQINQLYPERYPLYSMISFTDLPYAEARRIDREQRVVVDRILAREDVETLLDTPEIDRLIHESLGAFHQPAASPRGDAPSVTT